ncbi:mucin-2 isoform X2 [Anopheles coustani]|uniref:mucin-2 isoform X2 n=1 Tax=Anopheles coustani TaxID=139045 RepID=UPI002658A0EF|nr:mucin-2 isoform X2 [Anopheles coustani]
MDPADLAGPTTTASTTESSMVVEKTGVLPEKIEKEVKTSSDKNGSAPDSTVAKEKSPADVPKEGFQSTLKKPLEESEHKAMEQNSKDDSKSPVKQPVSTTATAAVDAKPEKVSGNSADASSSSGQGKETSATQEDDSENDDLLLRLEALEKGEDPDLINVQKKKEPEVNHQNGLTEQPAAEVPMAKSKDSAKEAEATESNASPQANRKPAKVETSPKKVPADEPTPVPSKEATSPAVESVESVSSNAKRKHSVGEPETSSTEPQTKKVHVGDVPDCPEPAVVKAASLENLSSSSAKASIASTSDGTPPSEESRMQGTDENPPSVEKMDVDVSPESQSSPDNLETLPDTEPNTEPDDKLEEISSSVAEEPTRTDSSADNAPGKSDNSNVSSSDDKRTGPNGKAKPPESEVSASVVPTVSEDEPMDVDEADTAGSSSATGVGTVSEGAVPVVEPLCVKKVAYLCTDEDNTDGPSKDVKNPPSASPTKPAVASTSVTGSTTPLAPSTSKEKTEVDSPKKASSSSVSVGKPIVQSEAVEVDSSNKPSSENASSASSASASTTTATTKEVMDESIVESSSQPSSTSDSQKKQLSDDRLNEKQLREAVHRSGLLAKASSTPNSNAAALVAASSSPLTPKTLHPVTTSAVSSSNVYSSTPIHANFEKVSSGNVSKITNPPSSVETSRVEADETMTTTTTANTTVGQSASSVVAFCEEKETTSTTTTATDSATKSSLSVTPTKGDATVATGSSTSKSSPPPKKDMLKREESSSTSSSSPKTTDSSEVDSCTVASAMNTAEEINMYTTNARKFNGISSTSEGSELDIKSEGSKVHKPATTTEADETKVSLSSTVTKLDLSSAISASTSAEQQYEVSVWYEGKDLQFLSVERIHSDKVESSSSFEPCTTAGTTAVTQDASSIIDSSSKQSSSTTNGSVSSFGPFPLPQNRASHADSVAHSSDSSSTSGVTTAGVAKSPTSTLSVPQVKQTVIGPKALCDLLIDEFKKLRRTFAPDVKDEEEDDSHHRQVDEQLLHTPKASGSAARGQRGGSSSTSKKSVAARGQKRTKAADSDEDDDGGDGEQRTPRASGTSSATKQSAKKAKSGESPTITSTATPKAKHPEEHKFDLCCLARWTDRKYYAGRVTNFRGDNKYVVVFEDGCSKTLSRDIIVFGEDGVLPILNHSIHALTGGDTYEPAIVEEIKRSDGGDGAGGEVVYAVRTASSKLEVTATDIYLTDEQAKWIHNSLKGKPDPMEKLLQSTAMAGTESSPAHAAGEGPTAEGENASEHGTDHATGEKGARSTRSKRGGAGDKTPLTPEAGFSGGVGKKGRRGRRLS